MSDNGSLENTDTRTCDLDAKSDQSDDDLVSLSSAESESNHLSENEKDEIDQTTQPHPHSVATEHAQTDNSSITSDGWFKVDANHPVTTPTQPLPVAGRSYSQDTESCASSAKTLEASSVRDPIPSSFTSLEDTETETGSIVSASPLPQTEDAATSSSSIEELGHNQQQDSSSHEEQLATGGEVGRTGTKEKGVAPGGMDSGRISPYLMISKDGNVARVTEFESPGLLYARPTSKNDESELVADEVAEDVLEKYDREEGAELEGEDSGDAEENSYEVGLSEGVSHIDPLVLGDLERRAKVIAGNLNHIMGNLRNSLHARVAEALGDPQSSSSLPATDPPPSYATAILSQRYQPRTPSPLTFSVSANPLTTGGEAIATVLPPAYDLAVRQDDDAR